jgi:hypothetical protein
MTCNVAVPVAMSSRFLHKADIFAEAGYQPTVGLMLAKWYSRDELALRFSFFYSTGAFA